MFGDLLELGAHQRGEHAPARLVGSHPDLADGGRVEHGATRHGHAGAERGRRAHKLSTRVHAPGAPGLAAGSRPRPVRVVRPRLQQRGEKQLAGGAQLVVTQGAWLVAQVGLPTS
jgi:hypothetical protein